MLMNAVQPYTCDSPSSCLPAFLAHPFGQGFLKAIKHRVNSETENRVERRVMPVIHGNPIALRTFWRRPPWPTPAVTDTGNKGTRGHDERAQVASGLAVQRKRSRSRPEAPLAANSNDQNRRSCSASHQHTSPDLNENVVITPDHPHPKERASKHMGTIRITASRITQLS